jgi:S1-C subfamily serine protease
MERIVTPTSAAGSECATIPEMPNLPEPLVGEYWQDSPTGLIQSDKDGSNLKLFGNVFGTEWSSKGSDTTETHPGQNIEKTSDTVRASAPQVLTKVRTKIRCVEAILKNAVIEPYHNNGQIEGLRITGLDRILAARDLLLKSGDIIRAVNGHPLNSKRQAYEIFKRARTKPNMIVDLLQDGEAKVLLFDFR